MITGRLQVGDCLILNECEQPSAKMIVVVTDAEKGYCQYLNADKSFDSFNTKPYMRVDVLEASRVRDYGVVLELVGDASYSCKQVGFSNAKYQDGKTRKWQGQEYQYSFRPSLIKLVLIRAEYGFIAAVTQTDALEAYLEASQSIAATKADAGGDE